jgi:hypothetical protein
MKVFAIELGIFTSKDTVADKFCAYFFNSSIFYTLNQIDDLFLNVSPAQLTAHLHSALTKAPQDFVKDTNDLEYVSAKVLQAIADSVGCTSLSNLCQLSREDLLGNRASSILQSISGLQHCTPTSREFDIDTQDSADNSLLVEEGTLKIENGGHLSVRFERGSQVEDKKDEVRAIGYFQRICR